MSEPLKAGQAVSWKWVGSNVTGKVDKVVHDGKAQVQSNKGNTITRNAREGDPAVNIVRKVSRRTTSSNLLMSSSRATGRAAAASCIDDTHSRHIGLF